MNAIIAHGYAHRLLRNNTLESTPMTRKGDIGDSWRPRSTDEMDLSGGDIDLIRQMLERLSFVFPTDERRLPVQAGKKEEPVNPMEPMG